MSYIALNEKNGKISMLLRASYTQAAGPYSGKKQVRKKKKKKRKVLF